MRVLQVIRDLDTGGAQVIAATLAAGLQERGHVVATAAMPGALAERFPGSLYAMPLTGADPRLMRPAVRALRAVIRDFRPDVMHAHSPAMMLVAGLASRGGRLVPTLATLHGSSHRRYRLDAIAAKLARIPLIACGPAVAQAMARAGHPVQDTILNGTEPRCERSVAQTRALLGLSDDNFLVLHVSRLEPPKEPLLLVDAVAQLDDGVILAFAGTGGLVCDIEARAASLDVSDRVRLLGRRDDVPDLMAAADVVALSSQREGLPLALIEAMSVGTPVVGTDVAGIRELIREGVDGFVAPLSSVGLRDALSALRGDDLLRRRLAAQAATRRDEFSAATMVVRYEAWYERLLRSGVS